MAASSLIQDLVQKIGRLIIVGFMGTSPQDPEVIQLSQAIEQGRVGGIIFFAHNIENPTQIKKLTAHFKSLRSPHSLILAIDQEGGKVKRLTKDKGFEDFPSARFVEETYAPKIAYLKYKEMAQMTADAGFNMVFGPCVDLMADSQGRKNPAIGGKERSFSSDPEAVIQYAKAFIQAHRDVGVMTSIKHFPGHGFASSDTHLGLVDVTKTFEEQELSPFYSLLDSGDADMIMTAHIVNKNWDKDNPVTLSPVALQKLYYDKGYKLPVISDDLMMGAIVKKYSIEQAIVKSLNAGVTLLIVSNNAAATGGVNASSKSKQAQDFRKPFDVIYKALIDKRIAPHVIQKAFDINVTALKKN